MEVLQFLFSITLMWALRFLGVLFLVLPSIAFAADGECRRCNLILISLDTVSAFRVGAYGGGEDATPNLDRLAKLSRVYLQAYAPAPWTLPSHATMLTGRSPEELGIIGEMNMIPKSVRTLAEVLHKNGYETAAFTNGGYVTPRYGFGRGFEKFVDDDSLEASRGAKAIAERGMQWLEKKKRKPFFLFLHSYHAHEPFFPSRQALDHVDPTYKGQMNSISALDLLKINSGDLPADQATRDRIKKLYEAVIFDMDSQLGPLIANILGSSLASDTIVIVTADHGEGQGEHGLLGLHVISVFEDLIRVPLIVYVPGVKPDRIEAPVELAQISASALSLLGLQPDPQMEKRLLPDNDGNAPAERPIFSETWMPRKKLLENLLSVFTERAKLAPTHPQRHFFFRPRPAHLHEGSGPLRVPRTGQHMVRLGDFKLIMDYNTGKALLFNLKSDPGEKTDLSALRPEKTAELELRLLVGH
jgi:arylsulfatase A-like enzyme